MIDAAELYESEPNERRKLEREHRDVSTSHEYYALVSLHNLCSCRIRRIKCGRVQYLNFFNGEERRGLYFKADEQGCIPTPAMLEAEFSRVSGIVPRIPETLMELYRKALQTSGRSGRARQDDAETLTQCMAVMALVVLAETERKYKLGIFPVTSYAEAREAFYKLKGYHVSPAIGSKDTFHAIWKRVRNDKGLILARAIMAGFHKEGLFAQASFRQKFTGKLPPNMDAAAWWFDDLLRHRAWFGRW